MRHLIAAAALIAATPTLAHEIEAGDLVIAHPHVVKAFPAARSAAGYVLIDNTGTEDERLIEVRIDGVTAGMHDSVEADGVVSMVPVDGVEIPAGDFVQLEPGGLHVMLMGLTPGAPAEGGEVEAVFVFERLGEVAVTMPVEIRSDGGEHTAHMD